MGARSIVIQKEKGAPKERLIQFNTDYALVIQPDDQQLFHGGDGNMLLFRESKFFKPVAAKFNFWNWFSEILVASKLGLNFQAPYFRSLAGVLFVDAHNLFVLNKGPDGAAHQQTNLKGTGLSPALRQALP